ncbi:unnamed protein product [Prunus brigantina]
MDTIAILVCYNGKWVTSKKMCTYEGGDSKGIIVSRNITFGELLEWVHKIVNRDNRADKLCLKFSVSISSNECKHIKIEDNDDVKFFIKYICEVIPSKVAPLLVSIEDRGVTNVIDMIDFTRVERMHSGDNGTEMNGLQMHSAPPILAHLETFSQVGVVGFGTTFELSIQHNWRQMGEQNVYNLGIVNDEEEDIESAYPRNNWDPKLEVGKIFSSKEALSNKLQLAAVRGHFEFKVKQSCKSRLVVVFIVVDATHLKCKYKGVLFVANAFDGNRNIYPLAFGIGDLETDASWHWFFSKLHEVIGECPNLVIVFYRNISIENVWHNIFPTTQHGICFYHMKGNMKRTFKLKKRDKLLLYVEQAAKSYGIAEFDRHFRKIKGNDEVAQYLESAGLHKWSRAHMDGRRYNVMTTNIAESINSVLRFARMLPVVHLIDEIINLLVKWFNKHRDFALKCTSTLCPDFGEKKLRRRLECASRMNVVKLNHVVYNVVDSDMDGHVHLMNNTCNCRKFQLEQLPCKHVVAICRFLKLNVYSMASRYYTRNTWLDAYSDTIYSVQP